MALLVVLVWLTIVVFSFVLLVVPVSVGRALLFAIPQLPVAGALKSNGNDRSPKLTRPMLWIKFIYVRFFGLTCAYFPSDLFAFAVGFCILSTIIAASRDAFAYVTSGRTRLLSSIICNRCMTAVKSSPLLFLWVSWSR